MKILAVFDINEEKLNSFNMEDVSDTKKVIVQEFGWCSDSGIKLIDFIQVD